MPLQTIEERFISDPVLDHLTTIHITGGAPMLSPKFLPVCEMIREYHGDVPINSPVSGLYPEVMRIIMGRVIKWLPQYRLNIALEGATKLMHEKIRGKGTWDPLWKTIEYMKDLGVNFRFNFTIYPNNLIDLQPVKEIAAFHTENPLYVNFGRYSKRFGHPVDNIGPPVNQEYIYRVEQGLIDVGWLQQRELNQQRWILQRSFWEGKQVEFQCRGGHESIDVDPHGWVYPCLMYPEQYALGNLKVASLSRIFENERTKKILGEVWSGKCSTDCPFTCALRIDNVRVDGKRVWK
jgi:radical SAM protein with 4Fe4S-binding SPASM domain